MMKINNCWLFLIGIILLLFTYCSISNATQLPKNHIRNIIIDTDVGEDDAIAILYLLNQPNVHVKAITIEADGNAHCQPAYANIQTILKLAHQPSIPVACGRTKPLQGNHQFTPEILAFCDTLGGTQSQNPLISVPTQTAKTLLMDTLQSSPQPLEILAIGPMTTLAEVFMSAPQLKNKIKHIYAMGGAVFVPGNVNEGTSINNKVAEWNIYIDPLAANIVFHSGVPITLIPLDVTNKAPITYEFYNQLKAISATPMAKFTFTLFKNNKAMIDNHEWYFWDPMAAVVMIHPEIMTTRELPLLVREYPDTLSGATVVDNKNGAPVGVGVGIDLLVFKQYMLSSFNGR